MPNVAEIDSATAAMLLAAAAGARPRAYAVYSGFPVGAALLDVEGRVFTGVNFENVSYGLATCAERSAVAQAVSRGSRSFRAIAVVGPDDEVPCPPCGSCRQILAEFSPRLTVVVAGPGGAPRMSSLADLLPDAFGAGGGAVGASGDPP